MTANMTMPIKNSSCNLKYLQLFIENFIVSNIFLMFCEKYTIKDKPKSSQSMMLSEIFLLL